MQRKIKITAGILTVIFCILLGCERKEEQNEVLLLTSSEDASQTGDEKQANDGNQAEDEGQTDDENQADDEDWQGDETGNNGEQADSETEYVIHICGAVQNPGVYVLAKNSRIYQAVKAAGGFTQDAAQDYLNQADLLSDGIKIYVPTLKEIEEPDGQKSSLLALLQSQGPAVQQSGDTAALISINSADEALLCTLPGIGSSRAKEIIAYREQKGIFQSIEEIKNVTGIKEGLFQKIKDKITV